MNKLFFLTILMVTLSSVMIAEANKDDEKVIIKKNKIMDLTTKRAKLEYTIEKLKSFYKRPHQLYKNEEFRKQNEKAEKEMLNLLENELEKTKQDLQALVKEYAYEDKHLKERVGVLGEMALALESSCKRTENLESSCGKTDRELLIEEKDYSKCEKAYGYYMTAEMNVFMELKRCEVRKKLNR